MGVAILVASNIRMIKVPHSTFLGLSILEVVPIFSSLFGAESHSSEGIHSYLLI